jgi:formate-dependent nitrite reductase membrane component NrfD
MHFNLVNWLFTDPCTATNCVAASSGVAAVPPEKFHYYIPWLIFCSLGVLIAFYYSVEGRKRFVKNKPVIKYMLDRYLGWFAIICILGYPLIFSRAYLYEYFFAWRVWRYLWLLALVIWAIIWVIYLVRKYPQERASYLARQRQQQYIPKGNRRKAATSR